MPREPQWMLKVPQATKKKGSRPLTIRTHGSGCKIREYTGFKAPPGLEGTEACLPKDLKIMEVGSTIVW